MTAQVLSGAQNVSYTNNTGQNVRIIINFMAPSFTGNQSGGGVIRMNWAGVSWNPPNPTDAFESNRPIGKNISPLYETTEFFGVSSEDPTQPTEIGLAPGQTFSAECGPYNIVVIPENG